MASPRLPRHRALVVTPDTWADPEMPPALVSFDIGKLFEIVMRVNAVSQETLGHAVGLTQSQVSAYVRGETCVEKIEVARRVVDGLDMPDDAYRLFLAGMFGRVPAEDEEDPMNRRQLMHDAVVAALAAGVAVRGALGEVVGTATASALRPDPTTADLLRGFVRYLDAESRTKPLAELVPMSESLVKLAVSCLREAPERLRPDIGRAAVDAMVTHWWFLLNTGRDADAESMAGKVTRLAPVWDANAAVGCILLRLGDSTSDPHERARLARAARDPHYRLPAPAAFLARWREVDFHLWTGDTDGLRSAVDAAQEAHQRIVPGRDDVPLVLAPLPLMNAEHLRMSALCLRLAGEGADAAPAYEDGLGAFPADRTRDVMYFRASLAVARGLAGDVEGATRDAEAAVELARADGSTLPLVSSGLVAVADRPHLAPVRAVLADGAT